MMKHSLQNRFMAFVEKHQLLNPREKVLLAVSGGVDSVVMTHLLTEAGYRMGIAHCNFKLRGNEADDEQAFVEKLAKKLKVPFFTTSFDTAVYAEKKGVSIQMAARELRYDWLEEIRKKERYSCIAVAHHKNDHVETVLLNLTKGTGMAGLHGILPKQGHIVRPLLDLSRQEIEKYAREHKLTSKTDASNADTKYERNKIRLDVIPELEKLNPAFIETFSGNIEKFKDAEFLYHTGLKHELKKLVEHRNGDLYIPLKKLELKPARNTLLYHLIAPYGFNEKQLHEILQALETENSGQQFFSATHRIVRDRKFLIITTIEDADSNLYLLEHIRKSKKIAGFSLSFHLHTEGRQPTIKENADQAYIDFAKLSFPLTIRRWKKGDYFYPLGMKKKKKKLSDFFTDRKLSIPEKERAWLLLSGDKIVWVIGHRLDERFSISNTTRQVLHIKKR